MKDGGGGGIRRLRHSLRSWLRSASRRSRGMSTLLFVALTFIKEVAAPFESLRRSKGEKLAVEGFEPPTRGL